MSEEDQILCKTAGISPEQLFASRQEWSRVPIMRRILEAKIQMETNTLRNSLESVVPESLLKDQGIILGLRKALGIIEGQGKS